jgi:hypothetical protein
LPNKKILHIDRKYELFQEHNALYINKKARSFASAYSSSYSMAGGSQALRNNGCLFFMLSDNYKSI